MQNVYYILLLIYLGDSRSVYQYDDPGGDLNSGRVSIPKHILLSILVSISLYRTKDVDAYRWG